jgi:hypothetical protein
MSLIGQKKKKKGFKFIFFSLLRLIELKIGQNASCPNHNNSYLEVVGF